MSELQGAKVIEAMNDGVTITDIQGRITHCNHAVTKQSGYRSEEIIGKTPAELFIAEKDRPKFFEEVENLLSGKPKVASDYLGKRKDGTEFPVSVSLSILRDTKGRPNNIVAVSRDITERKWMEQEIQQKNKQLEAQNKELRATEDELRCTNEELREAQEQLVRSEKLAAIGQLAGGVGHELRNPLGAIKNAAYYIRGKLLKSKLAQKEPRLIEFLDIMDEEINTSNKIINDLLNFARTGKPALSLASIAPVIDTTFSRLTIPETITVTKKLAANLPQVEIDIDQMRQVMVNLITNAIQAMPEGGTLTISARQKKEALEIMITDTGSGISEEVIGKVFDPLFTTKAKGIGLGLAVCKSIIDNHKGSISVSSKEEKGTTFTIKLPLNSTKTEGG